MKPSKDFSSRYDTALRFRRAAEPFIKEVLSYCCPGREHDFDKAPNSLSENDTERFISIGEECATDLAGDLINYFTPAEGKWTEYTVTAEVNEDDEKQVLALVSDREDTLFDLLQASNYNDMAPQWGFEAASHGTAAMWVDKAHLQQPIFFEAVQPHELLITPGHLGLLDRFREKHVSAQTLPALFDGWPVDLRDPAIVMKMAKPNATCKVCWGFWIDWTDPGNPGWLCQIIVDGKCVTGATPIVLGPLAGSCPLLVGRFNPQPGRPWARGPGWKALPDLRMLNTMDEMVMSGMDQSLMNTIIYPNDGTLDLEEGLIAGRAYAASRNFDRNKIFALPNNTNVDQGWFAEERIEARIRSAMYQDGPRQRGDTPPTAAQWIDERRRVQQRLGKPSAPLWTELIAPMVQRVEYLAVRARRLPEAITHNETAITVSPISPLQKASKMDQVMTSRSNLDLAVAVFQDQTMTVIDPIQTFKNIVAASGDELTVVRDEQEVSDAANPPV